MRNRELYQAMKDYVQAAISFLEEKCEPDISTEREWTERPDGVGVFDLIEREVVRWTLCIARNEAELHKLPEYAQLVRALDGDEVIRRQVGHQVTAGSESYLLELRSLTDSMVDRTVGNYRKMAFLPGRFEIEYEDLESGLYATEIEYEWLAPMPGFASDRELMPFDDHLSIIRMDAHQVIDCLKVGLIRGMPDRPTFKIIRDRFAVRVRESALKTAFRSLWVLEGYGHETGFDGAGGPGATPATPASTLAAARG